MLFKLPLFLIKNWLLLALKPLKVWIDFCLIKIIRTILSICQIIFGLSSIF